MKKTAEELYKIGQLITQGFMDRIYQKNILEKIAKKINIGGVDVEAEQYLRDVYQKSGYGRYLGLSNEEIENRIKKALSQKKIGKNIYVKELIGNPPRHKLFAFMPKVTYIPLNEREWAVMPSYYWER